MANDAGKKAKDGAPTEDELERRRAERDAEKGGDPLGGNGKSIEERAADGETREEEDGQFVIGEIAGENITLGKLIRGNLPITFERSLMSASVPGRDGMLDPNGETTLVVNVEVAKYEPIPIRERGKGDTKIVGWKIREHLRVVHTARADTEQGRQMLGLPVQAAAGE